MKSVDMNDSKDYLHHFRYIAAFAVPYHDLSVVGTRYSLRCMRPLRNVVFYKETPPEKRMDRRVKHTEMMFAMKRFTLRLWNAGTFCWPIIEFSSRF